MVLRYVVSGYTYEHKCKAKRKIQVHAHIFIWQHSENDVEV